MIRSGLEEPAHFGPWVKACHASQIAAPGQTRILFPSITFPFLTLLYVPGRFFRLCQPLTTLSWLLLPRSAALGNLARARKLARRGASQDVPYYSPPSHPCPPKAPQAARALAREKEPKTRNQHRHQQPAAPPARVLPLAPRHTAPCDFPATTCPS